MPSPFPGMNPYLEQEDVWHDFHQRFPVVAAAMLTAQVKPHHIVKIDQHTFIHELSYEERRPLGRTDIWLPTVDEVRQPFIEIWDHQNRRIITVVELLSPCNKYVGPDREQYLDKRSNYLRSNTHLVEIDLLRGGPRLPHYGDVKTPYAVFVSRWQERPRAGVLPIPLRERLPTIPIPLQEPHPDAHLDLQEVLHRVYDRSGYQLYIYSSKPQPALSSADTAWAKSFLPVAEGGVTP